MGTQFLTTCRKTLIRTLSKERRSWHQPPKARTDIFSSQFPFFFPRPQNLMGTHTFRRISRSNLSNVQFCTLMPPAFTENTRCFLKTVPLLANLKSIISLELWSILERSELPLNRPRQHFISLGVKKVWFLPIKKARHLAWIALLTSCLSYYFVYPCTLEFLRP